MKLYWAISPLRIFLFNVSSPLSTSAKMPRPLSSAATSLAYSRYIGIRRGLCEEMSTHIWCRDWYHKDLPRTQPEGPARNIFRARTAINLIVVIPFSGEMLSNNRNKPFQTAQYCTMDHDWAGRCLIVRLFIVIRSTVTQIETFRQLEVKLNRCALEGSTKGITDCDVDFGTIESSVAGIFFPFPQVVFV